MRQWRHSYDTLMKAIHSVTDEYIWNSTESAYAMTNTDDHAEMMQFFQHVCKASQIKRTTPKLNAQCHRRAHCCGNLCAVFYQRKRCPVLPKSAALSLKYVLIVYIWPESMYEYIGSLYIHISIKWTTFDYDQGPRTLDADGFRKNFPHIFTAITWSYYVEENAERPISEK